MGVLPPLRVVRSEAVTPRMQRLTLGGDALYDLEPLAPTQHVRLLFPAPGDEDIALPTRENGTLVYPPGRPRPLARSMTVRRADRGRGEIDIDIALHEDRDDTSAGPVGATACTRWARTAAPGGPVGIVGPGGGYVPPPDTEHHLLAGDETALPAMATLIAALPRERVHVIAEVADAADEQDLGAPVQWVHRVRGGSLAEAVRAWAWPSGRRVSAWVAGEGHAVRTLRDHLRGERGLDRAHCHAIRYWTQGHTHEDSEATFGAARAEARRRGIDLRTTQDVHELSYELMARPGG